MRIALVSDTYKPAVNGIATVTSSLAHELAAAGHEVAVLAPAFPGAMSSAGERTPAEVRFRSVRLPFYPNARACVGTQVGVDARHFLETFRPSVVHLQTHFFLGRAVLRLSAELAIPVLATCHCNAENFVLNMPVVSRLAPMLDRVYWRDAVAVYSKAQLMTVPTASMAALLRRRGVAVPVKVVANGVNTTFFSTEPSSRDEAVRAAHAIPRRDALLFVGRLDKDKGVNALIELLRMMAATGDGHLIVCGAGTQDGRLRKVARTLGMGPRVSFTGAVSALELASIYRLASALVMVGQHEVQPLAVLEALAAGLPILSLRTRNLEEAVADGVNGFLTDSVGHLYERARQLFHDGELRARLSAQARQTAEARFALGEITREFLTCYRSISACGVAADAHA